MAQPYNICVCLAPKRALFLLFSFAVQGEQNKAYAPLDAQLLYSRYGTFKDALLSSFLVSFGYEDARAALATLWPTVSIILLCLYNFLLIIIM